MVKYLQAYNDVCNYLEEIAKRHQRYNRIFYIDNNFYKNECEKDGKMHLYYKILSDLYQIGRKIEN